jgi:hypothetical protein
LSSLRCGDVHPAFPQPPALEAGAFFNVINTKPLSIFRFR